jgi:hypothetical protein
MPEYTIKLTLKADYKANGESREAVKEMAIHALRNFAVNNQRFDLYFLTVDENDNLVRDPLVPVNK